MFRPCFQQLEANMKHISRITHLDGRGLALLIWASGAVAAVWLLIPFGHIDPIEKVLALIACPAFVFLGLMAFREQREPAAYRVIIWLVIFVIVLSRLLTVLAEASHSIT
jgi:hypothetical protein